VEALILSYALDTNGQNARFVKAAEKWGSDDGVLEALALGKDDPAGVVARLQQAAEEHGGLRIRSAHRAVQYFQYPYDLIWNKKTEPLIRDLVKEADVIHLNNSWSAQLRFRIRKPMLLHHHGSMFRNNPAKAFEIAKHHRMLQCVSTIDLQRPDPKLLPWLPSAYDIDELLAYGEAHRREPDGRVRIVHAPTNRGLKHTDLLVAVVKELQAEGLPVDIVMVENKTWAECLKVKAAADIVFDQLLFGYGCNSIEAWAMGIPVISGADDWTLDRMLNEWGDIPFVTANEQTLSDVIRKMVKSKTMRDEWAGRGMHHVRRFHDEKPALTRLAELYAKTIKHYHRIRIPGKGSRAVTFRAKGQGTVYDTDGQPITFTDGVYRTDDPIVIARLRYCASRKSRFGIEEVA
jgi:hypothetical protein